MDNPNSRILTSRIQRRIVTPAEALEFLKGNDNNRKTRAAQVNALVRAIQNGEWRGDSNDMICIAPDGSLLNGQHRLKAIVASGIAIPLTIQFDTDPAAYRSMDTGRRRTTVDAFRHENVPMTTIAASVSRMIAYHAVGCPLAWEDRDTSWSPEELYAVYLQDRDLIDWAVAQSGANGTGRYASITTPTFTALMCWYLVKHGAKRDDVAAFMSILSSSYQGDAPSNHPARKLLIDTMKRPHAKKKDSHRELAVLFVKYWNLYVTQSESTGTPRVFTLDMPKVETAPKPKRTRAIRTIAQMADEERASL